MTLSTATEADTPAITSLRNAAAARLTQEHGQGHWSARVTEKGVLRGLRTSRVLLAHANGMVIGTVRLALKKPWAIDLRDFATVPRPLYLHDLAVAPAAQGQGVGRFLVNEVKALARAWPADAIRLDAYDHPAGAGPFYERCGFRNVGRRSYRGVPLVYFELLLSAAENGPPETP
jgi:GNAT superfamily N-acetyltransferase